MRSRWSAGLFVALGGLVLAPVGWVVTDRLEQENDFCNACHLPAGEPLHLAVRRDFDTAPPASLAAAHADLDADFRCIDCHGGVGPLGRARVKLLAARDALVWLGGDFDEPDGMSTPLWDRDCTQCHASFDDSRDDAFHSLAVHNVDLGVACVECHLSHDAAPVGAIHYIHPEPVRAECARCHPRFDERGGA